jgi:hypothetical protein
MANLPIVKQVFEKKAFTDTINTSFTELNTTTSVPTLPSLPSITEFFGYYEALFYDIPKFGDTESHQYLIITSQDYVGEVGNEVIDALLAELTELRQENLELQESLAKTTIESVEDALKLLKK